MGGAPRLTVDYGARYAHYDYFQHARPPQPAGWRDDRADQGHAVITTVAQRMVAPGAEEFLATGVPGPWLPPERTFAPLGGPDDRGFRVERARYVEFGVEHQFEDTYVLGVRRFYQDVDDQLVTFSASICPAVLSQSGTTMLPTPATSARTAGRSVLAARQESGCAPQWTTA